MIDKSKLSDNDKESAAVFEGIQPFTITVSDPVDVLFLAEALLKKMGCPDKRLHETLMLMARMAKTYGVEKGMNKFFYRAVEHGLIYPAFMKPIFIHMFTHIVNKAKNL
ncbi:MAG TPA: hypothetical protein VFQ26_10245 [Nitrospiraceae bacterium]|nr:hypothetical protein [Nitrospiraceae bacterium]